MAVVAESVNHLFTPTHQTGDYSDYHSSRAASSRSGRSTPHSERMRDVAHSFVPMSRSSGSQQSYQSQEDDVTSRRAQTAVDSTTSERARSERHTSQPSNAPASTSASTSEMDTTSQAESREHNVSMSSSTVSLPAPLSSPDATQRVQVRDLAHIQSLASSRPGSALSSRAGSRRDLNVQYEISSMPIEHIIEMVAGLLTKITTTNDMQHEHLHRQMPPADNSTSISPQTSSVLAFHGKNVPSITILSYLNRINKYCPTSYEVFLSLLVYFDRMTEKVNSGPIQSMREQTQGRPAQERSQVEEGVQMAGTKEPEAAQTVTPPASGNLDTAEQHGAIPGTPHSRYQESPPASTSAAQDQDLNLSHFFVVDSFNIHRLVIAGVTCASKFFSDIFYTNSRYAKVGGLPLPELNHLELQFLLLNDFRLSVPVEELEAYGTMLVEFYAREVVDSERGTDVPADANQAEN
ncbi:PHO85 cyclin-6-like protein [Elsinoe fawcettii]|nr:PHO85 cyclin-6-like protein [Elsinoe fawcettii]